MSRRRVPHSSTRALSVGSLRPALRGSFKKFGKMLPGQRRGPKDKRWTKVGKATFVDYFAKRSELLNSAESEGAAPLAKAMGRGQRWLFSSAGDEPTQVCAVAGAPIFNVVMGITGSFVALGVGQEPGVGTCHNHWVANRVEVLEGTAWAERRVRGGTGDVQLRLEDGRNMWCSSCHCRPWQVADGEPMARAETPGRTPAAPAVAAPPPSSPPSPPPVPPPPISPATPALGVSPPTMDDNAPPPALDGVHPAHPPSPAPHGTRCVCTTARGSRVTG